MQTLVETQKPAIQDTHKGTPEPKRQTESSKANDLNDLIDDVTSTKKEKDAKEEREKKLREKVQRDFVRIGDKYFKLVNMPDKNGRSQRIYIERQKTTIVDDFGRSSLKWIRKYEGFCQVPSHTNFRAEIDGFFNKYYELTHKPKAGSFDTILQVLNHVFGEHISFIIDYMHLLYVRPTQRLPIILLESKEKNTGKSTFGSLLKLMFQENAIKLGNSDFESDFNAIWINMLCIIVDETSLDKKGIMQMIKRLSTETNKVTSNEKNRAQTQIDFIGKFVFMSNDEGKALPIERGDPRFAVFKVPTFQEKGMNEDPNIEEKIINEIPAFLHHLTTITPIHKEQGRMYFAADVYKTKHLLAYYEGSKSYTAKAIQEFVRDAFEMFPDQTILHYSLSDIIKQLSAGDYVKKCDRQHVRQALESDLSLILGPRQRYDYFNLGMADTGAENLYSSSQNNRVYEFKRTDFIITSDTF